MKKCQKNNEQDIYDFYREELGNPRLTKAEIDCMRVSIRMIAEVTLDYLSRIQK